MKCKEITDGEFGFDNSDEKACEWSDYRFRYKSVLMENIEVEEKA